MASKDVIVVIGAGQIGQARRVSARHTTGQLRRAVRSCGGGPIEGPLLRNADRAGTRRCSHGPRAVAT